MLKYKLKCRKGFTLIEMAVVLVIIGIILTTVIKGGEVLRSSRIKGLIQTQNDLHQAVLMYREKFGYLPGDDRAKTLSRFTPIAAQGDGNSDGVIGGTEVTLALNHLQLAGFISGNYNGTTDVLKHELVSDGITISNYPFTTQTGLNVSILAVKYSKLSYDAAIAMEIAIDGASGNNSKNGSVQGSTIDDCYTEIDAGGNSVTKCADNDYTAGVSYNDLSSKKYTVYVALYPVAP